jgi:hypothetical protein
VIQEEREISWFVHTYSHIQGDSRGLENISICIFIQPYTGRSKRKGQYFGRCSFGHCEKEVHMNMCLIMKSYRDTAVRISRPNSARFLFVRLNEERSLQKKDGDTRRIARSHFDAAAHIKKREDQLRQIKCDLCTRFATCCEADDGISNIYCDL